MKKTIWIVITVLVSVFTLSALAQSQGIVTEPMPGQSIIDMISHILDSAIGKGAAITLALDFILRLFKSQKPLSVAYAIAALARGISGILLKFAELLDKVLPQRVK